jgi:spermidine/putrescine transport system ATP-binding protein
VRLVEVQKRYGEFVAVANMDLEVRPAEFLSILGPSGSGKTTTLRVIGGFVRPDRGRVEIAGRDVTDQPPNRRDVNTVFQSYALFPHMTVESNVGYGLKVRRVPRSERRERVLEALRLVRLEDVSRLKPSQLSGGMQQRVALARAIANRPSVLLLDEPLGALDRKLREDMQVELRQLQTSLGVTFIYVTHDQEEALAMSDRVVVMRGGHIEQIGSPATVYDDPSSLWVAGFVGASNRLRGTVRAVGQQLELETDVARVMAHRFDRGLAPGVDAVAVVRPEDLEVDPVGPLDGANRVRVWVEEVLPVGGYLRCIARTAGGVQLVAQLPRAAAAAESTTPRTETWFTWSVDAVRVYPLEDA